jgi:alpha-ketoglutarate-dependent 2,4-dichlorophenoxyacetate dioxygenase
MSLSHIHIRTYENTCPANKNSRPNAIREGELTIEPVFQDDQSSFGAEVSGVNWSESIPKDMVAQVRKRLFL